MAHRPLDPTDLLGPQPNSRLTVLRATRKAGGWYYTCLCTCGNTVTVHRDALRTYPHRTTPLTRSCGCLRAETWQGFVAGHQASQRRRDAAYVDWLLHHKRAKKGGNSEERPSE
jgi:hypothetical protein